MFHIILENNVTGKRAERIVPSMEAISTAVASIVANATLVDGDSIRVVYQGELGNCTCDAGGSAGCPMHDPAANGT